MKKQYEEEYMEVKAELFRRWALELSSVTTDSKGQAPCGGGSRSIMCHATHQRAAVSPTGLEQHGNSEAEADGGERGT